MGSGSSAPQADADSCPGSFRKQNLQLCSFSLFLFPVSPAKEEDYSLKQLPAAILGSWGMNSLEGRG